MLPLLFAAAGTALQAGATVMGGIQSSKANAASALGARIEADMARLRGTQTRERSRSQLDTMLGNIDALRTARGASLDSATGIAIAKRTRQDAYREEGIGVLAEMQRQGAADQAARGYSRAARWAIPMSVLQAGGSALQSAAYATAAFGSPRPGGGPAVQPGGSLYGLY
jgi:hypothetical protein